jgi:hypothetical protein
MAGRIAYDPCMRQEHRVAFVFWTQWIWFEAWRPTVKALSRSSLVSRFVIGAFIVGLSGFAAVEGWQKAGDQIKWFVWNNLIGAAAIFSIIFIWNWLLAPGRLLARDIVRELVRDWVAVINGKIGEAGRLIEAIRLGRDISAATTDFERWREETRRFLSENLPNYEPIFDDVEMGPFGPLLDLPAKLQAASPPGFQAYMNARSVDPNEPLLEMISRRKGNLQRIYESLLPMTISGEAPGSRG